ncbi:MAG: hypothetical protein WC916_02130 [Candidatus Woesearchaeota archaeon]
MPKPISDKNIPKWCKKEIDCLSQGAIFEGKTSMESVKLWANYVLTHKDWKKIHTAFINSQYMMHQKIMKKLSKEQKQALIDAFCKR